MLQQMASVAELEAGLISSRTKAALAAAKARGKRLGGHRGIKLSEQSQAAGRSAQVAGRSAQADRAKQRAADLSPVLLRLSSEGITSASAMARALTERGIATARGGTKWTALQVLRVTARAEA
jgi:DNA invertase Pin-like site-specific DNA recombinase